MAHVPYDRSVLKDVVELLPGSEPSELTGVIAAALGVDRTSVSLYLVDYDHALLQNVEDAGEAVEPALALDVATTLAGQAFQRQEVTQTFEEGVRCVWVPVTERDDRHGVLRIAFDGVDPPPQPDLAALGKLTGHVLATSNNYTDRYEMRRRRAEMNLAAEMQWGLLPPLSFVAPGVAIHGVLEPAYEIGGDVLDYAVNYPVVHVGIFDAMGHGLEAAQAASVALSAYRYCRRRGLHVADTVTTIDVALQHLYGGDLFVTGQLVQLDLLSNTVHWANAGHPDPYLVRHDGTIVEPTVTHMVPFGLGAHLTELGEFRLEEGDALLVLSDGSVEARSSGGEQFGRVGLQAAIEAASAAGTDGGAILRHLVRVVREHRAGDLEDDVTFAIVRRM